LGGALSEINLTLENKENSESVIKEIRTDRILKKYYPQDDKFPLQAYQMGDGKNLNPKVGGYYPFYVEGLLPFIWPCNHIRYSGRFFTYFPNDKDGKKSHCF
jgi:hypothetical protein